MIDAIGLGSGAFPAGSSAAIAAAFGALAVRYAHAETILAGLVGTTVAAGPLAPVVAALLAGAVGDTLTLAQEIAGLADATGPAGTSAPVVATRLAVAVGHADAGVLLAGLVGRAVAAASQTPVVSAELSSAVWGAFDGAEAVDTVGGDIGAAAARAAAPVVAAFFSVAQREAGV
jgi:hypothetical protein